MHNQTKTEKDQIRWAIGMWRKAWSFSDTDSFVRTCHRTVQSLELELKTGLPHCVEHLLPVENGICAKTAKR